MTVLVLLTMGTLIATATATSSNSWTKTLGMFWSDGQISDSEFLEAVQYLVDEGYIYVQPRIVEVEVIKEVTAQPMPTDIGPVWESIGALQEEDENLRWEMYNNMIGAEQYDEYGDMIGDHEVELIELRAEIHDMRLQLNCVINDPEANCTRGGMTEPR